MVVWMKNDPFGTTRIVICLCFSMKEDSRVSGFLFTFSVTNLKSKLFYLWGI